MISFRKGHSIKTMLFFVIWVYGFFQSLVYAVDISKTFLRKPLLSEDKEAVKERYRFYSYGDAMLIL